MRIKHKNKNVPAYWSMVPLICLCLLGCASNNYVHLNEMTDYDKLLLEEINRVGHQKKSLVGIKDGRTIVAENISVSVDSTAFFVSDKVDPARIANDFNWYMSNKGKRLNFPNDDIAVIRFDFAGFGFFHGLFIGAATGALIGNLYGRYEYAHMPYNEDPAPEEFVYAFYSCLGGTLGGIIGAITGASSKSKHYYYYSFEKRKRQVRSTSFIKSKSAGR